MADFMKTLPVEYTYRLSQFTGEYADVESTYKAIFHVNLLTMDGVADWINAFSRLTRTNWNVRDTHKELQIMQRKDFVCHMKDYHNRPKKLAKSSHRYKHCDCPAKITFKIKQVNRNSCKRYNWVRDGMPTTVFIENNHNHAILNAEALSFRKIDPVTRDVFNSYFDQGMSPTAAANFHIHQLDFNPDAEDDPVSRADASLNPTRSTVAYLYSRWRHLNKLHVNQTVDPLVNESDPSLSQNMEDHAAQPVLSMWKDLSAEIESALHKHSNNCDEQNLMSGMVELKQKLNNVHTGSQLCTFFHSFGQMVPRRYDAGSMIPTQPTAAARRKRPGITRGAKRQLVGRPAAGDRISAKRPRNLARNIEAGVPNAR